MNKRNYQKELEKLIDQAQKEQKVPSLFLHSCCAPCSSYVLEYLSQYFNITVFYYNPNIYPEEEYQKRVHEITRLVNSMEFVHPVKLVEGHYDPQEFFQMATGMENVPEGGERKKRHVWQQKVDLTILRPLCQSAHSRMLPRLMKSEKNWQKSIM